MQLKFDSILKNLLSPGDRLLLAVSGGRDSMCMAELFYNSAIKVDFAIAHCNFHLRAEESDKDAQFVKDWAKAKSIPIYCFDFDTELYASENGLSIEMAARELRYNAFAKFCKENGLTATAVAHNSDDNAETLMLNLLRGTGGRGLCGMKAIGFIPASSEIKLIRPILDFSREEITAYMSSKKLSFRDDSTNAESAYKRNKIRNKVFPLFEEINPSFRETFRKEMQHFREENAIVEDYISEAIPKVLNEKGIDINALKAHPHRDYILYRILEPYGISASTLASISELIHSERAISGKTFQSNKGRIITSSQYILLPSDSQQNIFPPLVPGPGTYGPLELTLEPQDAATQLRQEAGSLISDASLLPFPLKIRGWKPGDWMRPFGMKGRKKLSDIFNDMGLSLIDKENLIVIPFPDEDSHIAIIPGVKIDNALRVTPDTKIILKIRYYSTKIS